MCLSVRGSVRSFCLMACAALSVAAPSSAQSGTPRADPDGRARWSVWTGLAWQTPRLFGDTPNRELLLMAARFRMPLNRGGSVVLSYSVDLLPVMVIAGRYFDVLRTLHPPCDTCSNTVSGAGIPVFGPRARAFGMGVSPVGLELSWPRSHSPQLALNAGAGIATFTRDVPVDGARKFNVTAHMGAGMRFRAGASNILTLGYKLHHLSNAGTALNPGLDSSVWFVSWAPKE